MIDPLTGKPRPDYAAAMRAVAAAATAQRPVLMTVELADVLGLTGRMKNAGDSGVGVVLVDESDLLAKAPAGCRVEWGYPDAYGRFTPTVYAPSHPGIYPHVIEPA